MGQPRRRNRGQQSNAGTPPIGGTPDGRTTDEQARRIRAELEAIAGNADLIGLQVDAIWQWAQANPNSELHRHFTWNVNDAAIKRWRDEARRVISSVRYVIMPQDGAEQIRVRSIVSLKITDQRDETVQYNGYIDRRALLRRRETRMRFVGRAIEDLRQWCHRYCDVPELQQLRAQLLQDIQSFAQFSQQGPPRPGQTP